MSTTPDLDDFEQAARALGLAIMRLQERWDALDDGGAAPGEDSYPFTEPLEEIGLRALHWVEQVEVDVAMMKAEGA